MSSAGPDQDGLAALHALADATGATPKAAPRMTPSPEPLPTGAPTTEGLARVVAALVPEGGIICDEAISFGGATGPAYDSAAPHRWIGLTGGAIGDGLSAGDGRGHRGRGRPAGDRHPGGRVGAVFRCRRCGRRRAKGCPARPSSSPTGAMRSCWGNMRASGANPGPTAMDMLDLDKPAIDWVQLANGFGVEAARTDTLEGLADLLRGSMLRSGPFLIELVI